MSVLASHSIFFSLQASYAPLENKNVLPQFRYSALGRNRNLGWLFHTRPHSPSSPVLVYNAEHCNHFAWQQQYRDAKRRLGLQQRLEELGFVWDAAAARELRKQVEGAELGKGN